VDTQVWWDETLHARRQRHTRYRLGVMLGLLWGLGVGQLPTRAAVEYTVIDLGAGADIRGVDASGVAFGAWHSKAAIFTPAPIPLGLLPEGDASCVPEDACGIWGPLPGQMPSRPRRASPRTMSSGGGRTHARRVNPSSGRCGVAALEMPEQQGAVLGILGAGRAADLALVPLGWVRDQTECSG